MRTSNPRKTIFSHGRALASALRAGETFVEIIRALQAEYQVNASPTNRSAVFENSQFEELLFTLGVKKTTVHTKIATLPSHLDLSDEYWGTAKALLERYFSDYGQDLGGGPLAHLGHEKRRPLVAGSRRARIAGKHTEGV